MNTCKLPFYRIYLDVIDLEFKDLNIKYKLFFPSGSVDFYKNSNNN